MVLAELTSHVHLQHGLDLSSFVLVRLGDRLTAEQSTFFSRKVVELDGSGGRVIGVDQGAKGFKGGGSARPVVVCAAAMLATVCYSSQQQEAASGTDCTIDRWQYVRSRQERPLVGRILVRADNDYRLILRLLVGRVEADNDTVLAPRMGELFDGDVFTVFGNLSILASTYSRLRLDRRSNVPRQ
jgi:hypothetical protein